MHIVTVGLNHKTAPVEVREKLSFAGTRRETGLQRLKEQPRLQEAVILSTCNRTEIYAASEDLTGARQSVVGFLNEVQQGLENQLERYLYNFYDLEAVQHLFVVASGLDSMILGEPQILGQVKEALAVAQERKTVAAYLSKLFQHSVEVGKRVRTETEIGQNAVSISYAAVELARKIFGALEGKVVLIVGAGKMSELTVKNLQEHGASAILVTNRTYERACQLARDFGGEPVAFEALGETLQKADIVISSTGAPHLVIHYDTVQEVMRARRNRSLFLVDIAVPRDIDPKVNELDNVYLYNIDDLHSVVETNLQKREQQVKRAEIIISEELKEFSQWWSSRQVVPLIRALREHGDGIWQQELEKLFSRLPNLDEKGKNQVTAMAQAIVNKLLHDPVVFLKQAANDGRRAQYLEVMPELFGLEPGRIAQNEVVNRPASEPAKVPDKANLPVADRAKGGPLC
ncbi:MAG: glutamyl-tRNA reductase [Syntrophothermus sp.]